MPRLSTRARLDADAAAIHEQRRVLGADLATLKQELQGVAVRPASLLALAGLGFVLGKLSYPIARSGSFVLTPLLVQLSGWLTGLARRRK